MPKVVITPEDLKFLEVVTPQLSVLSIGRSANTLLIRGYTKDSMFHFRHTVAADRTVSQEQFYISDVPIMVVVDSVTKARRGELYVRLSLHFGGFPVGILAAGYIEAGRLICWPPGVYEEFVSGRGSLRRVLGSDPAAGSEISVTVPTNARWRLKALQAALITDATVATRTVIFIIDDGSSEIDRFPAGVNQAESITMRYNWYDGARRETSAYQNVIDIPMPRDLFLLQGWRVRTSTVNLQSGDNWSAPALLVEEWMED